VVLEQRGNRHRTVCPHCSLMTSNNAPCTRCSLVSMIHPTAERSDTDAVIRSCCGEYS
jgi:hypothetical protein